MKYIKKTARIKNWKLSDAVQLIYTYCVAKKAQPKKEMAPCFMYNVSPMPGWASWMYTGRDGILLTCSVPGILLQWGSTEKESVSIQHVCNKMIHWHCHYISFENDVAQCTKTTSSRSSHFTETHLEHLVHASCLCVTCIPVNCLEQSATEAGVTYTSAVHL